MGKGTSKAQDMARFGKPTNSCLKCNAWRGSLGLEPSPELFIQHVIQIFREVKRVLRKDGTVWLNLGDSYATHASKRSGQFGNEIKNGFDDIFQRKKPTAKSIGLKEKDLCMIPARVALALQADGWYLRSAMPWVKRSAMPESADDRPSSALEYMFLLTKSAKCYFDMEAIRKPQTGTAHSKGKKLSPPIEDAGIGHKDWHKYTPQTDIGGRNFRNTDLFFQSIEPPHGMIFYGDEIVGLDVNPQAMKEAHFATFPEKLIEPCILAGTSEKGCCVECGAPWERVVEKKTAIIPGQNPGYTQSCTMRRDGERAGSFTDMESKTIGWKPTCKCYNTDPFPKYPKQGKDESDEVYEERIEPIRIEQLRLLELWKPLLVVPCIVCDIFLGSGTSFVVSNKHGRNFIGIELSESYLKDIAVPRIEKSTRQKKLIFI